MPQKWIQKKKIALLTKEMIASWRSLASGLISCLCRREYVVQLQDREREAADISGPERGHDDGCC